jgi:hypothetical protein
MTESNRKAVRAEDATPAKVPKVDGDDVAPLPIIIRVKPYGTDDSTALRFSMRTDSNVEDLIQAIVKRNAWSALTGVLEGDLEILKGDTVCANDTALSVLIDLACSKTIVQVKKRTVAYPPEEGTFSVYFDKWHSFPNGQGVNHHTALPLVALRHRITERASGLIWMEAPPSSGKTSIGQILAFADGFKYCNVAKTLESSATSRSLSHLEGAIRIFIDEAQELTVLSLGQLRAFADGGSLIICAGVSSAPSPLCTFCNVTSCFLCKKCQNRQCQRLTCVKGEHHFVPTISKVVADTPENRIFVESLHVEKMELELFLSLMFGGALDVPRLGLEDISRVADILIEYTGGALGLTMILIRHVFNGDEKPFKTAFTLKTFLTYVYGSKTFLHVLNSTRLNVTAGVDSDTMKALLLNKLDSISDVQRESLRKQGLVKRADGIFQPTSRLMTDVLWSKAFIQSDHKQWAFNSVETLVEYVVDTLATERALLINERGELLHEDAINACIGYVLKQSVPSLTGCGHIGPCKSTSLKKYVEYQQVDHALLGLPECPTVIWETCLRDAFEHCKRFEVDYRVYGFTHGIIFSMSASHGKGEIKSWKLFERCFFYHLYVTEIGLELWQPQDRALPSEGLVFAKRYPWSKKGPRQTPLS